MDFFDLRTSLVCIVNSRPDRDTKCDPTSKENKEDPGTPERAIKRNEASPHTEFQLTLNRPAFRVMSNEFYCF